MRKARLAFWGLGYQTPRLGYLYDGVQIQRKCADDGGDDDVGDQALLKKMMMMMVSILLTMKMMIILIIVICQTRRAFKG